MSLNMEGVYFINTPELGDQSLFKIGWSQDINDRLKQLQTGNGFKLNLYNYILTSNKKLEKEIHESLKQHRKQGEWFKITESAVDKIVEQYEEDADDEGVNDEDVEKSADDEKDNIIEDDKVLLEEVIEETKTTRRVYNVNRQESYTCDRCNKSYLTKNGLQRHIEQKNSCNTLLQCKYCKKEYQTVSSLNAHERKKNCILKPKQTPVVKNEDNKCEYCRKAFSTIYSVKRHEKTCNNKKDEKHVSNFQLIQYLKDNAKEIADLKEQINVILQNRQQTSDK